MNTLKYSIIKVRKVVADSRKVVVLQSGGYIIKKDSAPRCFSFVYAYSISTIEHSSDDRLFQRRLLQNWGNCNTISHLIVHSEWYTEITDNM
jgi:hypothetical protein